MSKYTIGNRLSHTVNGGVVTVPDEVYDNQHDYDGKTFPVLKTNGKSGRAKLMGELYGLNTPGTGDMIVKIVR